MFSLSHTTGYAIIAMACLRECGNGLMLAKDIAACTGIPLPYLSKILHSLTRSGLIDGKRGYRGGFALNRPTTKISFYDVAVAIEGEDFLPECMLGLGVCLHRPDCPGQSFWKAQRQQITKHLKTMTLAVVKRPCVATQACGCTAAHPCLGSAASSSKTKRPTRTRQRSRA